MNVRFGIIGLGTIAAKFASALNTVEGAQLVSVASRNKARAEAFANKFGAKKSYNSYVDLVKDNEVDVVEFTTGILGENPTEVNGFRRICKTGVDEFATINMSFESGALATLSCGITANTNRDAIIYGTSGRIVVYDFLGSKKAEIYDNKNNLIKCFEDDFEDGFIYEIKHFAELYRNNKIESDIVPLKDNIACAGIFDELMK